MPNIIEDSAYFPAVPLLEKGQRITASGGETAVANLQAVALARRTANLNARVEALAGQTIHLIGELGSAKELQSIDTTYLKQWTAYYVDGIFVIWNGAKWIGSGSLVSASPGNALSAGEDGKLYVSNDIDADLVQHYQHAKE